MSRMPTIRISQMTIKMTNIISHPENPWEEAWVLTIAIRKIPSSNRCDTWGPMISMALSPGIGGWVSTAGWWPGTRLGTRDRTRMSHMFSTTFMRQVISTPTSRSSTSISMAATHHIRGMMIAQDINRFQQAIAVWWQINRYRSSRKRCNSYRKLQDQIISIKRSKRIQAILNSSQTICVTTTHSNKNLLSAPPS